MNLKPRRFDGTGDKATDVTFIVRDGSMTAQPVPHDSEQPLPYPFNGTSATGWEHGSGSHEGGIGKWVETAPGSGMYAWQLTTHTLHIVATNIPGGDAPIIIPTIDPIPHFDGGAPVSVPEAQYIQLDSSMLHAWFSDKISGNSNDITNDPNYPSATGQNLVYRVEGKPANGALMISYDGTNFYVLDNFASFTQADVDAGHLYYLHSGNERFTDSLSFSVSDGRNEVINSGSGTKVFTLSIGISPRNDSPQAQTGSDLLVNEHDLPAGQSADHTTPGGIATISTGQIQVSDRDGNADRLGPGLDPDGFSQPNTLYIVITDLPEYGTLYYNGSPVVAVKPGDMAALKSGGGYTTWTTDPATSDKSFTVISMADIAAGKLTYRHDGSEHFYDGFQYLVSDNKGITATNADHDAYQLIDHALLLVSGNQASVSQSERLVNIVVKPVNDRPERDPVTPVLPITVNENGFVTLTPDNIKYIDLDGSPGAIQFIIVELPKYGQLTLNGKVLGAGSVFTQADVDAGRVNYIHDGTENHTDSFSFSVSDSIFTSTVQSAEVVHVDITPQNNAPDITTPGTLYVDSIAGGIIINGISVVDPDFGGKAPGDSGYPGSGIIPGWDHMTVNIDLSSPSLTVDVDKVNLLFSGYTYSEGTNSYQYVGVGAGLASLARNGNTLTLVGSYAEIRAALSKVTVQSKTDNGTVYDPNGDIVMQLTVHDGVWSGSAWVQPNGGGTAVHSDTSAVRVYISPVNNPPTIDNPQAGMNIGLPEDSGYTLIKDAASNPIYISDLDAFARGGNSITLNVSHGTLMVDAVAGLTITGQGTSTLVLTGMRDTLNAILGSLKYKPAADYNGPDIIKFTYKDGGNTGLPPDSVTKQAGDANIGLNDPYRYDAGSGKIGLAVNGEFVITVDPVNDAPTVTAPTELYLKADYTFNGTAQDILGTASTITLGDIDITSPGQFRDDTLTVKFTASDSGLLTFGSLTGVTIDAGANGSSAITLHGSLADLNNALKTLTYHPADWTASVAYTLTIEVSDPGSGANATNGAPAGTPISETKVIKLYCSELNDAPQVAPPAQNWSINEDASFSKIFTGTVFADPDSFGAKVYCSVTVASGSLDISAITGFVLSGNPALQDGLKLSADGKTAYFKTDLAKLNNALKQLQYKPDADFNGEVKVTVYVNDLGYTGDPTGTEHNVPVNPIGVTGGGMDVTVEHRITVVSINDAPTIVPGKSTVDFWNGTGGTTANFEDSNAWTTKTVETLFKPSFNDSRDDQHSAGNTTGTYADAFAGVVITGNAATAAQGQWQYYNTNISDWVNISGRSPSNALYLDAATQIRFVPGQDFNGTPGTLTVRLVDSSNTDIPNGNAASPAPYATIDLNGANAAGGTTRYSATDVTLTTQVRAVNDAPTINNPAPVTMPVAAEDSAPGGSTINSLFNAKFSDSKDSQTASGGSTADTLAGIVITKNDADPATGKWQYHNGSAWVDMPTTTLSEANGLFLNATTLVRFLPAADWNGTPGGLTVHLADSSLTDVAHGNAALPGNATYVNLNGINATGGTTRYTTDTLSLGVTVTPVNDAPVIVNGTAETLPAVSEDPSSNSGRSVSSVFGPHFDDSKDTVTGGSAADAFGGVLITANTAAATQGSWQYSTNNGTSWSTVPIGIPTNQGFALQAAWLIRFSPNPDFNGVPGGLTVRLIDASATVTTTNPAASYGSLATISATGGVTRYSAGTMTLGVSVTAVNDAPEIAPSKDSVSLAHTEDTTTTTTVSAAFGPSFTDQRDEQYSAANPTGTHADAFAGVIITGNTVTATQGAWQYYNGSAWVTLPQGAYSDTNGLYLAAATQIHFVPTAEYNGTVGSLSVRLVENGTTYTTGTAGIDVSGASSGGATHISASAVTLGGSVAAVNDAPVATNPATTIIYPAISEDPAANNGQLVSALFGGRLDDSKDNTYALGSNPTGTQANALAGIIVKTLPTGTEAAKGTWQYYTGTTWVNLSVGMFVRATDSIRFNPAADYNGAAAGFSAHLVETSGAYAGTLPLSGSAQSAAYSASGPISQDALSVAVTVNAVNDAPTSATTAVDFWNGSGATLANLEDATDWWSKDIGTLFGGIFRDTKDTQYNAGTNPGGSNADSFGGVVIVGNSATVGQGEWQYSTDGLTWTDIGPRTLANALYLDAATHIRFAAAQDFNGKPGSISVRLVDTSVTDLPHGNPGKPAANASEHDLNGTNATGGTTCFSAADITLGTQVRAVNDAPTASATGTPVIFPAVNEDPASNNGQNVSGIFGGRFDDSRDSKYDVTGNPTGSQSNTLAGIIVGSLPGDASKGTWQYYNGSSWVNLATGMFVRAADSIRFNPVQDYNGTVTGLSVYLVENSGAFATPPASGSTPSVSYSPTGPMTQDALAVEVIVTAINDAPTSTTNSVDFWSGGGATLADREDTAAWTAKDVDTLFGGIFNDSKDDQTAKGGSAADSFAGIVVIGNAATATQGEWQYFDGTDWVPIGNRSLSNALYLNAATQIRFAPATDFNGVPGTLSVRLADTSAADAANGNPAMPSNHDILNLSGATSTGGTTRYSAVDVTLGTQVRAVNDAPVTTGTAAALPSVAEDTANPAGSSVNALFNGLFSDAKDEQYNTANPSGTHADAFAGIVIIQNEADSAHGSWQYYGSGTWVDMGAAMSDTNGLYLAKDTLVRFMPVADYNGKPGGLTVRLVEAGYGHATGDSGIDVSGASSGGATRVSSGEVKLDTTVTAMNDAPVALNPNTPVSYPALINEDDSVPGDTVSAIFGGRFSDAKDNPYDVANNPNGSQADTFAGVIVHNVSNDASKGAWQYYNGSAWVNLANNMFVQAGTNIRFQPVADWNGTPGDLSVYLVENSGAYAAPPPSGSVVSASARGGSTPISADAIALHAVVNPVNDAPFWNSDAFSPVYNHNTGARFVDFGVIKPDAAVPGSDTLAKTVSDALLRGASHAFLDTKDAIPGGSNANQLAGVLVTAVIKPTALLGDWWYLSGTTWQVISGVSPSSALFLSKDTQIRFVYNTGYDIPVNDLPHAGLSVALVDTSGASGAMSTGSSYDASTANRGGTTAVSASTTPLWVMVLPNNYYPEFTQTPGAVSVNEHDVVRLSNNVAVQDSNLDNNQSTNHWGGSSVTISRLGGANSDDTFVSYNPTPLSALGQGGTLVYGGVTYGTVTRNSGGVLTLTFNSNASSANVENILRSIGYSNASHNPPASVTLHWVLDDGNYASGGVYPQGLNQPNDTSGKDVHDQTVTIIPINDAPTAVNDTAQISSEAMAPVNGNVLANDWDYDGPSMQVIRHDAALAKYGTLIINADGTYTYTIDQSKAAVLALSPGGTLVEEIAYTITDGQYESTAVLRITITKPIPSTPVPPPQNTGNEVPSTTQPRPAPTLDGMSGGVSLITDKPVVREVEAVKEVLASSVRGSLDALEKALNSLHEQDSHQAVTLTGRMADQTVYTGYSQTVVVPRELFRHSRDEELTFTATMADGSPLPDGVTWNGQICTVNCNLDEAPGKPLNIKVIAKDKHNNSAAAIFRLNVVEELPPAAGPAAPEAPHRDQQSPGEGKGTPENQPEQNTTNQTDEPDVGELEDTEGGAVSFNEQIMHSGQQAIMREAMGIIQRLHG